MWGAEVDFVCTKFTRPCLKNQMDMADYVCNPNYSGGMGGLQFKTSQAKVLEPI
jgi:hypothetical protein